MTAGQLVESTECVVSHTRYEVLPLSVAFCHCKSLSGGVQHDSCSLSAVWERRKTE